MKSVLLDAPMLGTDGNAKPTKTTQDSIVFSRVIPNWDFKSSTTGTVSRIE